MSSSRHTLSALRRYEDPEGGFFEEFAERRLGPGGAFALLAGPVRETRSVAWAICPTVGPEQGNLRRLEALVARRLAGSGFEVARIRPDVSPLHGQISLPTRLAELEEAVELLRSRGAREVGLVGVLFGGTAAALAVERLEACRPGVSGARRARAAVRARAATPGGRGPAHG